MRHVSSITPKAANDNLQTAATARAATENPYFPDAAPWFVVNELLTDPLVDINIFANIARTPHIAARAGFNGAPGFPSMHFPYRTKQ